MSDNYNTSTDVDDLLNELMKTVDTTVTKNINDSCEECPADWEVPTSTNLLKDEENMLSEALKGIKDNIDKGKELADSAILVAQSTGDADHIEAAASVVNANVATLKALTEILLKQQSEANKLKMKQMDIISKEKIAIGKLKEAANHKPALPGGNFQQNNYLFSATPDKIFDLISATPEKKKEMLTELMEGQ